MEPLPDQMPLQSLQEKHPVKNGEEIKITMGMVDDPENQAQFPYVLNLQKCKNLLVIGGNQTGKTTFLQSLLYALIYNYSPEDINYYILDFSSKMLTLFDVTPHCGGVWTEENESGVERFFKLLRDIIAERKTAFIRNEVNSFEAYREIEKLPLILVLIDNSMGLRSWKTGEAIYQQLNVLIREANVVGIKFVMTANNLDDVLYKIKKEIEDRVAFSAKNQFEFGDILGVRCRIMPTGKPGHGLCKINEHPLEFLAAFYTVSGTEQQRIQQLKQEVRGIAEKYNGGVRARRVPELSQNENYEAFCADVLPGRIPLGYEMRSFRKISMPLKQLYCMSIYLGNRKSVLQIISNFLFAVQRENMNLIVVKKKEGSVFDSNELRQRLTGFAVVTILENISRDCVQLWNILAKETGKRKKYRDEFADQNGISQTTPDIMTQCSSYIRTKTKGLFVFFEDFAEFSDVADETYSQGFCEIFSKGKGYNYYFLGCYYPAENGYERKNNMQKAFLQDGFILLFGGQFQNQSLISLPMEYRNVTKISKNYNSCLMQYQNELYPLWVPMEQKNENNRDPDDAPII